MMMMMMMMMTGKGTSNLMWDGNHGKDTEREKKVRTVTQLI
jgi:hypothetical protein